MKRNESFEFHELFFPQGHLIAGLDKWLNRVSFFPLLTLLRRTRRRKCRGWSTRIRTGSRASSPITRCPSTTRTSPSREATISSLSVSSPSLTLHFQCQELCREGYEFLVVPRHFSVHRGVKRRSSAWEKDAVRRAKLTRPHAWRLFHRRLTGKPPVEPPRKCH